MFRAIWKSIAYDRYGRRVLHPAAVGMAAVAAAVVALSLILLVSRLVAAISPLPTPSASLCPEDPQLWQLVEIPSPLDPRTLKPLSAPQPVYRLDPPCVYQGLWRDLADALFASSTRADAPPKADKKIEVPWYWDPGPEIPRKPIRIRLFGPDDPFYDRAGRKIDEILTAYTALPTGDPDYPVLVYLFRDYPGAAYQTFSLRFGDSKEGPSSIFIAGIWSIRLEGGTVLRFVTPVLYHAGVRRWFLADGEGLTRRIHVVEADGSRLWKVLGVRGTTRSELARTFGKKDFFPSQLDLQAYPTKRWSSLPHKRWEGDGGRKARSPNGAGHNDHGTR